MRLSTVRTREMATYVRPTAKSFFDISSTARSRQALGFVNGDDISQHHQKHGAAQFLCPFLPITGQGQDGHYSFPMGIDEHVGAVVRVLLKQQHRGQRGKGVIVWVSHDVDQRPHRSIDQAKLRQGIAGQHDPCPNAHVNLRHQTLRIVVGATLSCRAVAFCHDLDGGLGVFLHLPRGWRTSAA